MTRQKKATMSSPPKVEGHFQGTNASNNKTLKNLAIKPKTDQDKDFH